MYITQHNFYNVTQATLDLQEAAKSKNTPALHLFLLILIREDTASQFLHLSEV